MPPRASLQAPLVLGIDPAEHAGIALLEPRPGQRPRLLGAWEVYGGHWDLWSARAFDAAEAVALVANGRPVVGWYEISPPMKRDGWKTAQAMGKRRGAFLQALADAGLKVRGLAEVMNNVWPSPLGLRAGKVGDGAHRIDEAIRLVDGPVSAIRSLRCAVDVAEAILIGASHIATNERPGLVGAVG